MNNYIQIYKDVLDPSYCKDLIHRFEKNTEHHETHEQGPMSFTQINFNQHLEYQEDVAQLSNVYKKYVNQYKQVLNSSSSLHHAKHYSNASLYMYKYVCL